jgi:hypothetical protein
MHTNQTAGEEARGAGGGERRVCNTAAGLGARATPGVRCGAQQYRAQCCWARDTVRTGEGGAARGREGHVGRQRCQCVGGRSKEGEGDQGRNSQGNACGLASASVAHVA